MRTLTIFIATFAILYIGLNYIFADYAVFNKTDLFKSFSKCAMQASEYGYFEGQKDAINGDIRIKMNPDSIYGWKKSCWNSGAWPTFRPTKELSKITPQPLIK